MEVKFKNRKKFRDYDVLLLEQWKTCVEAADNISEKRNNANNIYITLNTAMLSLITLSYDKKSVILSVLGIVICTMWLSTIHSYRRLNSVKYTIINQIEERLPTAPFKQEWKELRDQRGYTRLTKIESFLPILLLLVYVIILVSPFFDDLLRLICNCIAD